MTEGKREVSLTGIKPTGDLHIGNWLGAIRPALALGDRYDTRYFIADYHALTTQRDPAALRRSALDIAAGWMACGLDPKQTLIFRQSDVIEVFELSWVFACFIATGQLERAHAYKDAVARGEAPNSGLFTYPTLMAADIVLYDSNVVPVGADQKQHVELARDVAVRINHHYGEGTVVVPEPLVTEAPIVPGADGRKMSKSYGNVIPLFAPAKALKKAIGAIASDSTPLEAPKEPEGATVYELFALVAGERDAAEMAKKLRAGGYGWGHAKNDLVDALESRIAPMRERYLSIREDEAALEKTLVDGAERARAIAQRTMERVRTAIGIK